MKKIKLDQRYSPYQMPCVIIGTIVDEKPNFMLCTWVSRINRNPPVWMASINKEHYTMEGINQNKMFSMNFPPTNLVKETDYIGNTTGRETDKSSLFKLFYRQTKVPMIEECPLNIEFSVEDIIEYPDHFIVLGTAINTYASEQYLLEGIPDMKKMNPIIHTGAEKQPTYWSIGEKIGDAFKIGKDFKQ